MTELETKLLEALRAIVLSADRNEAAINTFLLIDARAVVAEAEAAPQPSADGWIPWAGGECPVCLEAEVRVKFRSGLVSRGCVQTEGAMRWTHLGGGGDIVAYRVVKESQQ